MDPVYVWLVALVAFVIIEIATMGLTTIWFAGGAFIALFLALVHVSVYVQIGVFLVVSIVLLICTRPLAVKFFNQKTTKTNVDSIIGKQAIVLVEINNLMETGQVMLNGMEWSARTYEEGKIISAGAVVEVKEIQGVKLIVIEKVKE
ncbi:MAG: NfeD family protein [Lachnospiraceae bacterium]|nr:NfeD family protein [Lachnospiraceae bacterium]